ncbi:hypothetical protein ACLOJK_020079 [Asimina triloba]
MGCRIFGREGLSYNHLDRHSGLQSVVFTQRTAQPICFLGPGVRGVDGLCQADRLALGLSKTFNQTVEAVALEIGIMEICEEFPSFLDRAALTEMPINDVFLRVEVNQKPRGGWVVTLIGNAPAIRSLQENLCLSQAFVRWNTSEASLQKEAPTVTALKDEKGFKGHDMLAPFTAGWQSSDLHPLVIDRSEGSYVYDINGKKYLDSLAGLWCTALGGNEPRLVAAATAQLNTLPFYHSFWNRTTRPSLDLAKELLDTFTARTMGKIPRIAAFIAEPVMGAGGVIPPPKTYFEKIQAVVKKYDILFIADEVICAFGRLGTMFGCDKYNIKPDLVSVAKALSSAYMPIGAALVSPEISDVIYSQSNKLEPIDPIDRQEGAKHVAIQGETFMSVRVHHEIAPAKWECLTQERNIVEQVQKISPKFQDGIKKFADSPIIGEIRGTGLILGTEFTDNKSPNDPFPPEWGIGAIFGGECEKRGMLVRVAGDTIMMSPPFIMSPEEVDELIRIYGEALKATEEKVNALKSQKK